MDPHTEQTLAFLEKAHARGRHPFHDFLETLRRSKKNCIFSAGEMAANVCAKLTRPEMGIKIHCCSDNDARKWGKTFYCGVPCIPVSELVAMGDEVTVLIVTGYCDQIYPQLKAAGLKNVYVLNKEFLILYADELMRRVATAERFQEFRRQVETVMGVWADEPSRRTAATIIRNWFSFSEFERDYVGINVPDQYFPADVVPFGEREVFVDLGAFDGKNTLDFIARTGNRFDAAYAFEMDHANYGTLVRTVRQSLNGSGPRVHEILSRADAGAVLAAAGDGGGTVFLCRLGAGARNEQLRYRTQSQASAADPTGDGVAEIARVDDVLDGRRATFLKMDIEGAEMAALEGAQETIRRWKPKIAGCVYHNPDHLLRMPLLLKELVPEYRLYLRHHTITDCETVCYAIPAGAAPAD